MARQPGPDAGLEGLVRQLYSLINVLGTGCVTSKRSLVLWLTSLKSIWRIPGKYLATGGILNRDPINMLIPLLLFDFCTEGELTTPPCLAFPDQQPTCCMLQTCWRMSSGSSHIFPKLFSSNRRSNSRASRKWLIHVGYVQHGGRPGRRAPLGRRSETVGDQR